MNLVQRARRSVSRSGSPWPLLTLDQLPAWMGQFGYQGLGYGPALIQTYQQKRETIQSDFVGYINGAYKTNGPVFACVLMRMLLFSEATFQFRGSNNGRPGKLYGTKELRLLEEPWSNATTGDLLCRMEVDLSLSGNFYATTVPDKTMSSGRRICRMRPDWVTIILGSLEDHTVDAFDPTAVKVGYLYTPGGPGSGLPPRLYQPDQVCHYAVVPDPMAHFRGMSWLQPVLADIMGDRSMTTHKLMFFENGAPQPLTAEVLTPIGWRQMGDLRVGSKVIGRDGAAHEVLGVYPQGEQDIYRVSFSDGTSTRCTMDHLWEVANCRDRRLGRTRSLSLARIMEEGLQYPSGANKWSVPMAEPAQLAAFNEPLTINPYFLGLLLGDGSFRNGVSLCSSCEDVAWTRQQIKRMLPVGVAIIERDRETWTEMRFSRIPQGRGRGRSNRLTDAIRKLGLFDTRGTHKFIPENYLFASIEDRVALLQGLVDSDGHIEERQSSVSVTTTSHQLAHDIVQLVGSLGGHGKITYVKDRRTIEIDIRRLPEGIVPCRLPRKVERYRGLNERTPRYRLIKSVDFVGCEEARCIHLDGESLYVTDDFIVTHNTPNLVVSMDTNFKDRKTFTDWVNTFRAEHEGSFNAYKTLYLGHGSTAQVIGSTIKDLDYRVVQSHGEARIASAAGLPPIIMGFQAGLEASTYSNYGQARRAAADQLLRPLWRNAAGSLAALVNVPGGSELWYDDRDISFLQADLSDQADVQLTKATAIRLLVDSGYEPESVVNAIESDDLTLLDHSGLYSVQLQAPSTTLLPAVGAGWEPGPGAPPPTPGQGPPSQGNGNQPGTQPASGALPAGGRSATIAENVSNVPQLAQALLAARRGEKSNKRGENGHL